MTDLIEHLRSLGFGGALGAGLFGFLYLFTQGIYPVGTGPELAMSVGGLLGAGTHGLIDKVLFRPFISPLMETRKIYEQKQIIIDTFTMGYISEECRDSLLRDFLINKLSQGLPTNMSDKYLAVDRRSNRNRYKESCFDAIMWAQEVENLVRDCVLKCVANRLISPKNDDLEKIKNTMGLGGLVYEFKPCISEELFLKLKAFSKDRNALAHDAADRYMINSIAGATDEEIEREIWKFEENKRVAGDLYGELLELHTKFSV